jgi:tetratricopeptide (TPR) repeat protein
VEDFDQARAMFERSISIEPMFRALSNLGELYFQDGRAEEAIRLYKEALRINDREHTLWGNLGDAYLAQSKTSHQARASYEKAAELVSKSLDINPDSAAELSFLALYRARLGHSEDALKLITKAVLRPDATPTVFLRAGEVCEVLNRRTAAIGWVSKAIGLGYSANLVRRNYVFRELLKDLAFESKLLDTGLSPPMTAHKHIVL